MLSGLTCVVQIVEFWVAEIVQRPLYFQQAEQGEEEMEGIQDEKVDVVTTKGLAARIWIRRMRACTCGGATGRWDGIRCMLHRARI